MKEQYEGLKIGSKAYAISFMYQDGKLTNHCGIFPVIIKEVTFTKIGSNIEIEYWVTTPKGQEWSDSIDSKNISDSFDELVKRMKETWEREAEFDTRL